MNAPALRRESCLRKRGDGACGKRRGLPATRLRDADDVKDQKQRHGKRRNQAEWQNGHWDHWDYQRTASDGAESDSVDEIEDAQNLPGNEAAAMADELECRETSSCADEDVT